MKKIIPLNFHDRFLFLNIEKEKYELIKTPDIYRVTKDNYIKILNPEISIYKFQNCEVEALSDVIDLGEIVFWHKFNYPFFAQTIPRDSNIEHLDLNYEEIKLRERKSEVELNNVFSLCGVNTDTWSHFLLNYLPKLNYIKYIPQNDLILLIPSQSQENIKDLIKHLLERRGLKSIKVVYAEKDTTYKIKNLYHCTNFGFLNDDSKYVHPTGVIVSSLGSRILNSINIELSSLFVKKNIKEKIFIARGEGRNLYNYDEVEAYFRSLGYLIIHPHSLSLEQKIQVFGNASHIVGPLSSGFANIIFATSSVKVLSFVNYARSFDPFISGLSHAGDLKHEVIHLTGKENVVADINNSYYISLDLIKSVVNHYRF